MYESYQDNSHEHKSYTRAIAITFLSALVLVVGICLLIRAFGNSGIVYDDAAVEGGWENLSQEEIEAALNEKVAQGMINISMNTAPVFADGQAEGNVMIVNETINNYPQKVEFVRNDTQEVIYTSNAIPVGSKIEHAALDVDLDAGTYECTALFHNLDPETGAILGTAGAIINITIQN